MVSTVTNLDNPSGSLQTVFGDREVRDGTHEGYRIDLGMWLDCCHNWGLEADYFDVTGQPDNYDSGLSNGFNNGNPFPIVRAFYDPGLVNGVPLGIQLSGVAYPNQYVGRITVDTDDYFQSAGVWLRRNLRASEWSTNNQEVNWTNSCARTFRLDAIAGYRFARLIDSVDERDDEMSINRASADYLTEYTYIDSYHAVNTFNGADLGLNAVCTFGRWSVDVVTKAAIGFNNQYVRLYGLEQVDASNTGGGIQASSGTQEYSRDRFSAIPELTVTGGYQVTDHVKITVGYDLLYWSAVVRGEPDRRRAYDRLSLWNAGQFYPAAVQLQRVALLGPGLASGRRVPVLSNSKVKTKKGQGAVRLPALLLQRDSLTCRLNFRLGLKPSRFRPRRISRGAFAELDRPAGRRHPRPAATRSTVRAPRRTGRRRC